MKNLISLIPLVVMASFPALGHHSDAGMDMESVVAFEGTVTEFNWRNPHVYAMINNTDGPGEPVEWAIQMGGVNVLSRRGWRANSLAKGDRVTVRAHPMQSGRPYGIMESIDKEGGLTLATAVGTPKVTESSASLQGTWKADRSATMSFPGGFDGFFHAQLKLTQKGVAAQAQYNALSDENPESTCVGRPTPAALVSTSLYLMSIEISDNEPNIIFTSEWFDEVRTIYMDGRGHPENDERFATGHSIGWWEEDTLVVDTTNFTDHRSPYQIGVPSGKQKHVIEKYRLTQDGTQIAMEFMLEDPEYIAEPMFHRRELMYSPHLEMYRFNCDPEATRRFVSD
ncbi:MAG: DUF6152 family protein [Gammaproteobacteria bacterium]